VFSFYRVVKIHLTNYGLVLRRNWLRFGVYFLLFAALLGTVYVNLDSEKFTNRVPQADANTYLKMAYNMVNSHTFSHDQFDIPGQPVQPTMKTGAGFPALIASSLIQFNVLNEMPYN